MARLTVEDRRSQRRQDMMQAILDTSREIMREEGVAALSLHEVARRLGMRAPSLYTYFPSKMAIYDAVFRAGWQLFGERMRAATVGPDFASILEQSMRTRLQFAIEYPELHQLMTERPVPGFVPSDESMALVWELLAELDAVLLHARDAGWLRADVDLREARELMLALSHGIAALHVANEPDRAIGEGRFGSLIDPATRTLCAAWLPEQTMLDETTQGEKRS